jgi:hypothetical protein
MQTRSTGKEPRVTADPKRHAKSADCALKDESAADQCADSDAESELGEGALGHG